MPSIAQQDYIIIAPKEGRALADDAAAMGQLKKAVLNGTSFDCLLKDPITVETGLTRVVYTDEAGVAFIDPSNDSVNNILPEYTPDQYSGLAAVQEEVDRIEGNISTSIPVLTMGNDDTLKDDNSGYSICVDGKYLDVTGEETVTALAISDEGPAEGETFINITWDDAQKLIGLPLA